MTKSLLRRLSVSLAPVLVLAIGGGFFFAGQPPAPRAAAYALSLLIGLAIVAFFPETVTWLPKLMIRQ